LTVIAIENIWNNWGKMKKNSIVRYYSYKTVLTNYNWRWERRV